MYSNIDDRSPSRFKLATTISMTRGILLVRTFQLVSQKLYYTKLHGCVFPNILDMGPTVTNVDFLSRPRANLTGIYVGADRLNF
jgi:hypothetical protein